MFLFSFEYTLDRGCKPFEHTSRWQAYVAEVIAVLVVDIVCRCDSSSSSGVDSNSPVPWNRDDMSVICHSDSGKYAPPFCFQYWPTQLSSLPGCVSACVFV